MYTTNQNSGERIEQEVADSVPQDFVTVVLGESQHTRTCRCQRCREFAAAKVARNRQEERAEAVKAAPRLIAEYFHCAAEEVMTMPVDRIVSAYRRLKYRAGYNRFLEHVQWAMGALLTQRNVRYA